MSLLKAIADWRPRTPFYYGWLVLAVAGLGAYAASGVAQLVIGGIQNLIFEDTGWDRSTIAYAVTAGTWSSGLLTPFIGRLADRYGPRWLMVIASLTAGVCFFALAGMHAVWQFYVAYIISRAIANPILVGVVPRTAAVNYFQRKRNFALGLISMARPISGAINIQIISLIAQAYSWRAGYRYLGAFSFLLVIPLFLIMRRRPSDIGLLPDGDSVPMPTREQGEQSTTPGQSAASRGGLSNAPPRREFDWKPSEAALCPVFWLILMAESLIVLTSGTINYQVVPYLSDSGVSLAVAAGALSLSSVLGAVVNPAWGYLSDRFSPRTLVLSLVAVAALAVSLFLYTPTDKVGFYVVIIYGAVVGGLNILGHMMIAQYFGRASFGSIIGLMGPFQTGSLGLGPSLGALLFSLTGGYTVIFVFTIAAYMVAFTCFYIARPPRLPRRAVTEGFVTE